MPPTTFVEYLGPVVYVSQVGIVLGGLVLAARWLVTRVWGPCEEYPDGWAETEEVTLL